MRPLRALTYGIESSCSADPALCDRTLARPAGRATLTRHKDHMKVELTQRQAVYLDMLITVQLESLEHKMYRDKRLFEGRDIDIHERLLGYQAKIDLLKGVHEAILSVFPLQ